MIHVKYSGNRVIGYEVGTRQEFDLQHAGDESWMFLDRDHTTESLDLPDFFTNPQSYRVDQYKILQKLTPSRPDPYLFALTDSDGSPLTDPDGSPLFENTRFKQPAYLIDADRIRLVDRDGVALII